MTDSSIYSKRHWMLKEKAQRLRSMGLSYKEIAIKIPVAKSTISLWCRDVKLTNQQIQNLWEKRSQSLAGIKAIQKLFWVKRTETFNTGLNFVKELDSKTRFIAGLAIYWGEGTKQKSTAISNSDPRIILFMVKWLREFYNIDPRSLTIELHLHSGQNEKNMQQYWSKLTRIPVSNFRKSFIKPEGSGYRKNVHYYGTVKLRVTGKGSTYLLFRILGSIAGLIQYTLGEKANPEKWMAKLPYA